jgi:dCTP deaminase
MAYLTDEDLRSALEAGDLICEPRPSEIDPSSFDLHLDSFEEAKVWDAALFGVHQRDSGSDAFLRIGSFSYTRFASRYMRPPGTDSAALVYRTTSDLVVRPGGFVLWQSREVVGTPAGSGRYICFVNGKSTRTARTGLLVHLTAPTIHAGWHGRVVLEISNLGPFDIALRPGDALAQITVSSTTAAPTKTHAERGTSTLGQQSVEGRSS